MWLTHHSKIKLETKNRKTIEKINKIRWLFEEINQFVKPLARVIKKKRENTNPWSGMKEYITVDSTYI